jgi:hypothetical protein
MDSYRYRITVEKLTDAKGQPVDGQSLCFYAANHDDILAIVSRMRERLPINAAEAASLGVGLKLFSEVALVHRNKPLFAEIRPAIGSFIQQLKQDGASNDRPVPSM